jgi:hypothetical protein
MRFIRWHNDWRENVALAIAALLALFCILVLWLVL